MNFLNLKLKNYKILGVYMDNYDDCYNINTLNIIYMAEIDKGKMKPQDDVSEIQWFDLDKIPMPKLAFKWIKVALKDLY